jgi:hypothetical protein
VDSLEYTARDYLIIWEYTARDYLIIWTEFVVWRAAIWQNCDYVSVVAFGREFWEIYTISIQYKVEFGCRNSILLRNTTDGEYLWSWWRLNLMYVVWGYEDSVNAFIFVGRRQFSSSSLSIHKVVEESLRIRYLHCQVTMVHHMVQ